MRKPRDYDAELKSLTDKAKQLKTRKQSQLGELVITTGADVLTLEELAGALLAIAGTDEPAKREGWRKRGAAFFSGERQRARHSAKGDHRGAVASESGTLSLGGKDGAA
jgi:DNA-binding protein H-NS